MRRAQHRDDVALPREVAVRFDDDFRSHRPVQRGELMKRHIREQVVLGVVRHLPSDGVEPTVGQCGAGIVEQVRRLFATDMFGYPDDALDRFSEKPRYEPANHQGRTP